MLESFCSHTIGHTALIVQWWDKNHLGSYKAIEKDIATAVHCIRVLWK